MDTVTLPAEPSQHREHHEPASGKAMLGAEEKRRIHASWRAAHDISIGQIYLYDNPLLKKDLTLAIEQKQYIDKHGRDMPAIRNCTWGNPA
jgi:xylulose-5-phosphate/fructose-6-phosphate phosphoketolase